jgi:hypothetical protein
MENDMSNNAYQHGYNVGFNGGRVPTNGKPYQEAESTNAGVNKGAKDRSK